jgi:hypothetical protein
MGQVEPEPVVHAIPEDRVHDPREQEEWFQRLPPHAQEEARDRWRDDEDESEERKRRRHDTTMRYLIEGVLLFSGTLFFFRSISFVTSLTAIVAGVAMGAVWRHLRMGQWGFTMVAGIFYFLYFGIFGLNPFEFITFITLAAGMGAMHEFQRYDGSEL